MAKVELKVDGMTCEGCVRGISKKLSGVSGVERARVDLTAGKATVVYDEARTDPDKLIAAVEQIGYKASRI
jgi:copper chaperone